MNENSSLANVDRIRKLYRNKFEIIQSRVQSRRKKTTSGWFRDRGYNAVLRVQNTPGGRLSKMIKN